MAGLGAQNGKLFFFNVNELEMMSEEEHFMCTDIEWDPSGVWCEHRISCTSLSLL